MRVFISHSSKDAELAARVCESIEQSGHGCFLAPRDIRSGCEYAEEIINGIDGSDVVLLLLSQAANDSPHVLREIERAVSKKKSVIVYKLEEVTLSKSMEYFLMTHQWLASNGSDDFSEVILRINEYAAAHGMESGTETAALPEVKKEPVSRRRSIILAIAAAVLLCGGVALGAGLANRTPPPVEPAAAQVPEEPRDAAPEQQTSPKTEPPKAPESAQEESKPEIAPEDVPVATTKSENTAEPPVMTAPPQTEINPPVTTANQSEPAPQEQPAETAKAEIGDSLLFGTYNGEPIKWRVLRVSEDGKSAVVISESILTMKAYDAAEGGEYNKYDGADYWTTALSDIPLDIQRQIRGDNRWEFSNIRTWLNSERENVEYSGQAPTSKAMAEKRNGYHTEAGFLNGFTKAERSALVETEITTNGAVTRDRVFLLSSEELAWLYDADVSVFAKPTEAAVSQDKSNWYKVDCEAYGVEDFFWWLRDANPETACECYYINLSFTEERVASGSVGLEGYGIRPAATIDLTSETIIKALENANAAE